MSKSEFCYSRPECGPSTWKGVCNTGFRQSPIALIQNASTPIIYPEHPIRFSVNYNLPHNKFFIQDNGHTVQVHLENSEVYHKDSPFFGEGPDVTYVLAQIHLHWGSPGTNFGSEHTLNGIEHPMEIHMVHYSTKFTSLSDALENGPDDAVTVLGVFVDIGETTNNALASIVVGAEALLISNPPVGTVLEVLQTINLHDLLPADDQMQVFRYSGSLTTPPCTEKVKWVVFKQPITISKLDLERKFEELPDADGEKLVNNFRPTQPLLGRKVEFQQMNY
jgi:carbonic anhydrase